MALCAALAVCLAGCVTVKGGSDEPAQAESSDQAASGQEEAISRDGGELSEGLDTSLSTVDFDGVAFSAPSSWTEDESDGKATFADPSGRAMMVVQIEDVSELYETTYDLMKDSEDVGDVGDYVSGFIVDMRTSSFVDEGYASDAETMDVNGNKASIANFQADNVLGGLCIMLLDGKTLVTVTVGGDDASFDDDEFDSLIDMFGEVVQSISLA